MTEGQGPVVVVLAQQIQRRQEARKAPSLIHGSMRLPPTLDAISPWGTSTNFCSSRAK